MTPEIQGKRRKRYRPDKSAPDLALTERDIEICTYLAKHRFLDTPLIFKLFPEAGYQGLQRRLRILFDHQYIDRPPAQVAQIVFGNRPLIYGLADKGLALLKTSGYPLKTKRIREANRVTKFNYIDHCLDVARVRIAFEADVKSADHITYKDEDALLTAAGVSELQWPTQIAFRGETKNHNLSPDGGFGIEAVGSNSPKWFFLEVDLGTEPIVRSNFKTSSIVQKMLAYADTHSGKPVGLRNFRVLFVTTSQARVQAIQEAFTEYISAPSGLFLFTTLDQTTDNPLGPIWQDGKGQTLTLLD